VESESEPEIPVSEVKILASKTRMSILKILSRKKYTISELSKELNLSKPTVLYHIRILENAGYIKRIEDRKWVYYELTNSGRSVLMWRKLRVILPLITAAIVTTVPLFIIRFQGAVYFVLIGIAVIIAVTIYMFKRF